MTIVWLSITFPNIMAHKALNGLQLQLNRARFYQ